MMTELRRKFKLRPDAFRHTFATMHIATYKAPGACALESGNTEKMVRERYANLNVTKAEGALFWEITPRTAQRDSDARKVLESAIIKEAELKAAGLKEVTEAEVADVVESLHAKALEIEKQIGPNISAASKVRLQRWKERERPERILRTIGDYRAWVKVPAKKPEPGPSVADDVGRRQ